MQGHIGSSPSVPLFFFFRNFRNSGGCVRVHVWALAIAVKHYQCNSCIALLQGYLLQVGVVHEASVDHLTKAAHKSFQRPTKSGRTK